MFHTVFYQLKDPKNIGMVIRSHVAFAGGLLVFAGYDPPYSSKKREKAFSRSLFKKCEKLHFTCSDDLFNWTKENSLKTIAVEIAQRAEIISDFNFPDNSVIIFGNESNGLPDNVIERCDYVVRVPQYGGVGSLNVAMSASIVMYEISRKRKDIKSVIGKMYDYK